MFNKIHKTIQQNERDKVNDVSKKIDKLLNDNDCVLVPVCEIAGGRVTQYIRVALRPKEVKEVKKKND